MHLLFSILALNFHATAWAASKGRNTQPAPIPLTKLKPGEPEYCRLEKFLSYEIQEGDDRLIRGHSFQLGQIKLVGMSVGKSSKESMKKLAEDASSKFLTEFPEAVLQTTPQTIQEAKYCTWYLHYYNQNAAQVFNWRPVHDPRPLTPKEVGQIYLDEFKSQFSIEPISFLSCLEQHHYAALGCHGMLHRGPSVFAMLLSYSGCQPESSLRIVNELWGLNGVSYDTRLAIAKAGYELGFREPEASRRMRNLFHALPVMASFESNASSRVERKSSHTGVQQFSAKPSLCVRD